MVSMRGLVVFLFFSGEGGLKMEKMNQRFKNTNREKVETAAVLSVIGGMGLSDSVQLGAKLMKGDYEGFLFNKVIWGKCKQIFLGPEKNQLKSAVLDL